MKFGVHAQVSLRPIAKGSPPPFERERKRTRKRKRESKTWAKQSKAKAKPRLQKMRKLQAAAQELVTIMAL